MKEAYNTINKTSAVVGNAALKGRTGTGDVILRTVKAFCSHNNIVSTGFNNIDDILGSGLKKENLYVLAARPCVGKTALALNIVNNVIDREQKALYISLKDEEDAIRRKLFTIKTGEDARTSEKMEGIATPAGLVIKMINAKTVDNVIDVISEVGKNPNLIFVDEIQQINDWESDHNIGRKLKDAASSLCVPIVVLSNLPRTLEVRPLDQKRPLLSDLEGQSDLAESADEILFLYRDEYYDINTEKKGIAEIIRAKGSDEKPYIIELSYNYQNMRFFA